MVDVPQHRALMTSTYRGTDPLDLGVSAASARRHTAASRHAAYPDPEQGAIEGVVSVPSGMPRFLWSQNDDFDTPDMLHSAQMNQAGQFDLGRTRELAGTRKSRSRNWPARSNNYPFIESSIDWFQREGSKIKRIGQGMSAGQDLMAIFGDLDDKPRTKYSLEIERGRNIKHWPQYPHFEQPLRGGMSLEDICLECPGHVWGTGLRLFIAEGWTGEKIYRQLPPDAANHGAATRKWNFLQQAMGREVDRMQEEDGQAKRVPQKRKRVALSDDDSLYGTPELSEDIVDNTSDHHQTPGSSVRPRKIARSRVVEVISSPASRLSNRDQSLSDMTGGEDIYRGRRLKRSSE